MLKTQQEVLLKIGVWMHDKNEHYYIGLRSHLVFRYLEIFT